jgi:hypothetical protein
MCAIAEQMKYHMFEVVEMFCYHLCTKISFIDLAAQQ